MSATFGKLEGEITVPSGWTVTFDEGGGGVVITMPPGTYYHSTAGSTASDFAAEFQGQLNASALQSAYTVTVAAGENGTGKYTITSDGDNGVTTVAITWTQTDFRDVIGFTGDKSGLLTYTGTNQARSLWLPDYIYQDLNGGGAWKGWHQASFAASASPSGHVRMFMGPRRREMALSWPTTARAKTWIVNESTVNESFEKFLLDALYGEATWAAPAGPIRFYPDADTDGTSGVYKVIPPNPWKPAQRADGWAGLWTIDLPRMIQVPA